MVKDRVKNVVSRVFNISKSSITDNTSPDNVEKWDSLQHMQLIVALEQEFGVEFTGEQMNEMLNYKLIVITIQEMIDVKK